MLYFKHTEILILLNQTWSVSLTSVFQVKTTQIVSFFLFRPPRNLENETDFKIWCNCNVIICYGSVIFLCICIDKFLSCENIVLRWNVPLIKGKASAEKNPTLFQITHNYQGRRYLTPLKKNNHIGPFLWDNIYTHFPFSHPPMHCCCL